MPEATVIEAGLDVVVRYYDMSAYPYDPLHASPNPLGWRTVGAQRGGSLKINNDLIDITSKDSDWWKEYLSGLRDWTIECNGLFLVDDPARDIGTDALQLGQAVLISFQMTYYVGSPATVYYDIYRGQGIVKTYEANMPYTEATTYTTSFTGKGAFTIEHAI